MTFLCCCIVHPKTYNPKHKRKPPHTVHFQRLQFGNTTTLLRDLLTYYQLNIWISLSLRWVSTLSVTTPEYHPSSLHCGPISVRPDDQVWQSYNTSHPPGQSLASVSARLRLTLFENPTFRSRGGREFPKKETADHHPSFIPSKQTIMSPTEFLLKT